MPLESPILEDPSETKLPFSENFLVVRLVFSELLDMLWLAGLLQLDPLLDVAQHHEFGHLELCDAVSGRSLVGVALASEMMKAAEEEDRLPIRLLFFGEKSLKCLICCRV